MIEVGRICTKIAGREAGKLCVVIEVIDDKFCIIDGDVRRKKCNFTHLDPLDKKIAVEKGASHEKIVQEFKKLGIEIKPKVRKEKKPQIPAEQGKAAKASDKADEKEKIKKGGK